MPSAKPTDPVSHSNVIAFVWDFDKTLSAEYMQGPLFRARGIDPTEFWDEVFALQRSWEAQGVDVLAEHVWVEYFLNCIRGQGRHAAELAGLNRQELKALGSEIEMFHGAAELLASLEAMPRTDPRLAGFAIEHHVVSTGFRDMIEGSPIAPYLSSIRAVNLVEDPAAGVICNVAYPMSHAGKTTALYEINKGVHVTPDLQVDDVIPREFRYAPFQQLVYSADGPSDAAAWSVTNSEAGTSVVVYDATSDASIQQAFALHKAGRVQHMLAADFSPSSAAWTWYHGQAVNIALSTVAAREHEREGHRMHAASHLAAAGDAPAWLTARPAPSQPVPVVPEPESMRAVEPPEPVAPDVADDDIIEFGDLYR